VSYLARSRNKWTEPKTCSNQRCRPTTPRCVTLFRFAQVFAREVYASADGATAWRLNTPDGRLFVVLSPEPSRGFSGATEPFESLIARVQPRVVVLDTLTALLKGGKRDTDVFRTQYAEVSRIRKMAEDFKTAIILVHHVRKGGADCGIEAIAGTGGIGAAIDGLLYLKRKAEGEGTLEFVGREREEKTIAVRFEQEPVGWRVLGDDVLQLLNSERREVLELLREEGGLTPAQIAIELGKPRPATRKLLQRMREDEQVKKQGPKYVPLSFYESQSHRERVCVCVCVNTGR
jgi:AAA domain/Winged helix-turn-helix DNA-binding